MSSSYIMKCSTSLLSLQPFHTVHSLLSKHKPAHVASVRPYKGPYIKYSIPVSHWNSCSLRPSRTFQIRNLTQLRSRSVTAPETYGESPRKIWRAKCIQMLLKNGFNRKWLFLLWLECVNGNRALLIQEKMGLWSDQLILALANAPWGIIFDQLIDGKKAL